MEENKTVELEWDDICATKDHVPVDGSVDYYKERLDSLHQKRATHRRENIIIDAIWYLIAATGVGFLATRLHGNWHIATAILAAAVGMVSAYGFGLAAGLKRRK